jgi:Fe-S-cluster containining protein
MNPDRNKEIFSKQTIKELLHISVPQQRDLKEIYALIPAIQCQRRTHCCSLLPEMTLVEALAATQQLVNMSPTVRKRLTKKIVGYFFVNPVEITPCPFLDGRDCLIYRDRFFGCRAYGLWSREYYEKLAASSHQAKKIIRNQWERLGVFLPQAVIHFQIPYCLYGETEGHVLISDEMLLYVSEAIEKLSEQFLPWHQLFSQRYFSDLSFLFSSLVFGFLQTVRMKFTIVRDIVTTGDRSGLDRIIEELPDLCAELI